MKDFKVSLNKYFLPQLMFGIHSQTAQKSAAEDFLRYAFQYIHENTPNLSLNPVFRDGLLPQIQNTIDRVHEKYRTTDNTYPMTYGAENEIYTRYIPTEADYHTYYEPLLSKPNMIGQEPALTDSVYTIFAPTAEDFLNGNLPLEQATDEIYSRISLLESEIS